MKKDILKEEFDRDVGFPEDLSKSNMIKMLEESNITPEKKTRIKFLPKALSVAAMFIILIVAVFSVRFSSEFVNVQADTPTTAPAVMPSEHQNNEQPVTEEKKEPQTVTKLKVAKSEKDLKNHFVKMYAENKIDDYIDRGYNYSVDLLVGFVTDDKASDVMAEESLNMAPTVAATAAPSAQSATGTVPHGTTNVQVADVDEGDIIKNDGRYLYIVNRPDETYYSNAVTIVDTETMSKIYSGRIELKDEEALEKLENNAEKYMHIQDIYVNGDILTVLCTYNEKTYAVIYDISERHAPKEIRRFDQDGYYTSSRMVDGILYTITNYTVRGSSIEEVEERAIPKVDCDCIHYSRCYMIDEDSTNYIVVSAFDTTDKDSKVNSISVLGNGYDIYSTSENLYVYATDYISQSKDEPNAKTNIYSFAISGTDIKHKATGAVTGTPINQYSLDEYKGNLRIATTYYDYRKNVDISSVYVLNTDLKIIGQVTDIARDEQVKAVRFMGETGYVVTFRNTDPLFIIDFSNPENPVITGELKIPGYSYYIHPLGNDYLVGIGYDGTEENAKFDTVKISVFDVSDKTNPKETDTFVIKNAYCLVSETPKAFFYYSERNMLAVPVRYDNDATVKTIQTFTVKEGKITDHLGYIHSYSANYYGMYYGYYNDIFRGTYIGNMLYTISNNEIFEHNLDSGENTRMCVIASLKNKTSYDVATTVNVDGNVIATVPPSVTVTTPTTSVIN